LDFDGIDDDEESDCSGAPEPMILADFIAAELMEKIILESEFELVPAEGFSIDDYVFL
jgi:hypothetical protein